MSNMVQPFINSGDLAFLNQNNSSCSISDEPVTIPTEFLGGKLTFIADPGYRFTEGCGIYVGGLYQPLNYGENDETMYLIFSSSDLPDSMDDFLGFSTYEYAPPFINEDDIIFFNDEKKCHPYINDVEVLEPTEYLLGDKLTLIAFSGWAFVEGAGIYDGGIFKSFIYYDDDTKIEIITEYDTIESTDDLLGLNVYQTGVDVTGGINRVYKVDSAIMEGLAKERFDVRVVDKDLLAYYDHGQFIINLISLPFEIDDDIIIEEENIQLATKQLTIKAPLLTTDVLNIDLGSINAVGESGNLLDYTNTIAILHLPFIEPFIVEIDYFLDNEVKIDCKVNVYTGLTTYNLSSTKLGENFFTKSFDLGVNVPFANSGGVPTIINNSNVPVGRFNDVRTTFIEIIRTNSSLANGFFAIPILEETQINNVDGYIEVENISINSENINTTQEYDEIINILQNGVIKK